MNRRPVDPHKAAEEVFKRTAPKAAEPAPRSAALPGAKELVSIRLDREVLDHFQSEGAGWQDRINEALKKLIGK